MWPGNESLFHPKHESLLNTLAEDRRRRWWKNTNGPAARDVSYFKVSCRILRNRLVTFRKHCHPRRVPRNFGEDVTSIVDVIGQRGEGQNFKVAALETEREGREAAVRLLCAV